MSRSREDKPAKTVLFEHIHFASLWTTVQAQSGLGAYGLAGMHATIDVHGRWQIYAFPRSDGGTICRTCVETE